MKPRIFVSSTCYDLKHVRDDLLRFLRTYNLEPILSENGDIGYSSGIKELDLSCYEAIQSCDMVILIVGNRYGSPASDQDDKEFEEYISVTRKEFKTAIKNNMPIFCFVDSAVLNEFSLYQSNVENIKIDVREINFTSVDNINIFKFIQEIYSLKNISVMPFSHSDEIEEFLSKQFSDMIKQHLEYLKIEKQNEEIKMAMNGMESILKRMNIMIDSVGKEILEQKQDEYKLIIDKQDEIILDNLKKNIESILMIYLFDDLDDKDSVSLEEGVDILISAIKKVLDALSYEKDINKLEKIFMKTFFDVGMDYEGDASDLIKHLMEYDEIYNRIISDRDKCEQLKKMLLNPNVVFISYDDVFFDE